MHSIKKNPTTTEQKALKEKERSAKLKIFCQLRDKIFVKRSQDEFDEELLNLCEAILAKNPDIYTLWNIRRETIEKLKTRIASGDVEILNYERLLHDELGLTEQCIKANPKSYSAWFQRSWVLNQQATPDLQKEMIMCKAALAFDCRNFHCWDHRRIVAKKANLTDEEELMFSNQLIADNFSNFSAWHMRMSLIPRFGDENEERLMKSEDVQDEMKRVANAIFTDPEDQSAWMYARYIIDLYSPSSFLNNDSSCPTVPLSASINSNRLFIVFTRATTVENALFFLRGIPVNSSWRAVSLLSSDTSRAWECVLEEEVAVEISPNGKDFEPLSRFYRKDLFERLLCGKSVDVIETMRKYCEELLEEEKNNSLALMTVTQCLRLTSPIESHSIIIENLDRLATTIDPLRANMYRSIASYEHLRHCLLNKEENAEKTILEEIVEGNGRLSLKYLQLSELPDMEILSPFLTDLDVRGNRLHNVKEIYLLPLLTHFDASENPIEDLPSSLSYLSQLDFLSCSSTLINDPSTIGHILHNCPSIKRFMYCQTPLVDNTEELRTIVGDRIRLFPYYL